MFVYTDAELENALNAVVQREAVAFVVPYLGEQDAKSYERQSIDGKAVLETPWLRVAGYDFIPHGPTELAGNGHGFPDFPAHRDFRDTNRLNLHFTKSGITRARFVLLPDEEHDESLETKSSLDDYEEQGYDVLSLSLHAGDTVCFLGGVVTHEFTSVQPLPRTSLVRSFDVVQR